MVIVVDDNVDLLNVYRDELEYLGVHSKLYSNAREMVASLDADLGQCDLLILDLHMPHMTGEQLILEVRERSPELPIAVLTGEAMHFDNNKTLPLNEFFGVDLYEKPIPIQDVLKKYGLGHDPLKKVA